MVLLVVKLTSCFLRLKSPVFMGHLIIDHWPRNLVILCFLYWLDGDGWCILKISEWNTLTWSMFISRLTGGMLGYLLAVTTEEWCLCINLNFLPAELSFTVFHSSPICLNYVFPVHVWMITIPFLKRQLWIVIISMLWCFKNDNPMIQYPFIMVFNILIYDTHPQYP